MAAPRPEHAHATARPATATLPPRPAHTTTGWRQDRRPVVSKRPLHRLAAAKMSPHIHIGPEPVLAAHARSPPAAGSRCPAGADSAPHSEQNFRTPVRPRVEAPREMTMHLLPVSPPPAWAKCFPIPAATGAPPNLPPQWWCSIAQCIAHRASTPEARWPQINQQGRCLGLQTPHCCTCAGPHARASPIALPAVPVV